MLFDKSLQEWTQLGTFACPCGHAHALETGIILQGKGCTGGLDKALEPLVPGKKLGVVTDANTYEAAGKKVIALLEKAGYSVTPISIGSGELHANETTVGRIVIQAEELPFLLAVGSGVVNDTTRYAAARTGIAYGNVGTAPSMDGYLSRTSPITLNGFKRTHEGIAPSIVVADSENMVTAPDEMVEAGMGDLFGKLQSVFDWQMGNLLTGEWYCRGIADAMVGSADLAMQAAKLVHADREKALELLTDGLLLAGGAMQLAGSSRPASGCEHHLAHYWEIIEGKKGPVRLHGEKVGVGTGVALYANKAFLQRDYILPETDRQAWEEEMFAHFGADHAPAAIKECAPFLFNEGWPLWMENYKKYRAELYKEACRLFDLREGLLDAMDSLGGPTTPADRGYTVADMESSLHFAPMIRGRLTTLAMLARLNAADVVKDIAAHTTMR